MSSITMFNIPIYLRSGQEYYKEQRKYEEREIAQLSSYSDRNPDEEKKRLQDNPWLYDRLYWWPPWQFNDIIGWVSINYDGRFWAEIWRLARKRIVRDPRHRRGSIVREGKIAEDWGGKTYSGNNELRQGLLRILEEIGKETRKRQLYVELEYWRGLIASLDCEGLLRALESLN